MELSLTSEKVESIVFVGNIIHKPGKKKIREIAVLLGLMTAYAQGLKYGQSHIKYLEIDKNKALQKAHGNFERLMHISVEGTRDIQWWLRNIDGFPREIKIDDSEVNITTDASLEGWGAHVEKEVTGGRWLPEERDDHINVLELKAILLGLQSLVTT